MVYLEIYTFDASSLGYANFKRFQQLGCVNATYFPNKLLDAASLLVVMMTEAFILGMNEEEDNLPSILMHCHPKRALAG
jgi:hypothetical protein